MNEKDLKTLQEEVNKMTKEDASTALHDGTNSHTVYKMGDRNIVTSLLRSKVRAKTPAQD